MDNYHTDTSIYITEYQGSIENIMPLLLIGDESETMIARYLSSSVVYAGIYEGEIVAVCAVVMESDAQIEVKNLAVQPDMQRKGIGRSILRFIEELNHGKTIILGTGETPSTLRFYKSCGYRVSHKVPDFFTDNYPHPIIEEGVLLCDMIYLAKHIPR